MSRRRKHRIKLKSLYVWHRYIGLSAALFVLVLSITGLMLNHTESFELDSRYVQNEFLLDWYGISEPELVTGFAAGGHRITLFGHHLYFDVAELYGEYDRLTGAVLVNDVIAISTDRGLTLLGTNGAFVDHLGLDDGVPAGIQALGTDAAGRLLARTSLGIVRASPDFIEWLNADIDPSSVRWIQPSTVPAELSASLLRHHRGEVLPWERVLLDIHSGRILSANGVLVMDIAAILLILLSLSGFYMWLRRRR